MRSRRRGVRASTGSPGPAKETRLGRIRSWIVRIPRGKVATYGRLAALAGFPRAARLTVRALRTDAPLPWHRVVAAGGRIALPGVEGAEQRLRLQVEGVTFRGNRVRMDRHEWRPRLGGPIRSGASPRAPSRGGPARARPPSRAGTYIRRRR
ncbi:MAG TPA: MGMT family protein [Thermoplasmata archaeon]|nr:MGMT family protein [Thermoplasmata archaeon]